MSDDRTREAMLSEHPTVPRSLWGIGRAVRKVRRIARQASHTKLLDSEADALVAAGRALIKAAEIGRWHQKNAEELHAEWEAKNGPDLEHLH